MKNDIYEIFNGNIGYGSHETLSFILQSFDVKKVLDGCFVNNASNVGSNLITNAGRYVN